MKKLLLLPILALLMGIGTACNPDPEVPVAEYLTGTWVYDHPEEGITETMKFFESGTFYFSNKADEWKLNNENINGNYTIDGDNVTGVYTLNGTTMNLDMTFTQINELAFTAKFNDTGLTFTYARLLTSVQVKPGESVTPDYSRLLGNVEVVSYRSHKTGVATVSYSGTIEGVASGHTYVDVVTTQGTAVVEVTCFDSDNLFEDYTWALGKTVPEVVATMGNDYIYRDDKNGVVYLTDNLIADTVKFITEIYEPTRVEYVLFSLNSRANKQMITESFGKKYRLFSSSNDLYAYATGQMWNGHEIVAIYDENNQTVYFAPIRPTNKWPDFTDLFGTEASDVEKRMNELNYPYDLTDYGYSKDGSIYYDMLDCEYAFFIGFVFNPDKKVCEYWVYTRIGAPESDIHTWLSDRYIYQASESSNSQKVYYDSTKRYKVVFDYSGYVSYTDTQQKPFVAPGGAAAKVSVLTDRRHAPIAADQIRRTGIKRETPAVVRSARARLCNGLRLPDGL